MLITREQLEKFSGVYREEDDTLAEIYIDSAKQRIIDYVGYDPETCEDFITDGVAVIPKIFMLVNLEIATLIQAEEGTNLGVNTSQDIGVNRTYLNVVNYDRYLERLSAWRKI